MIIYPKIRITTPGLKRKQKIAMTLIVSRWAVVRCTTIHSCSFVINSETECSGRNELFRKDRVIDHIAICLKTSSVANSKNEGKASMLMRNYIGPTCCNSAKIGQNTVKATLYYLGCVKRTFNV